MKREQFIEESTENPAKPFEAMVSANLELFSPVEGRVAKAVVVLLHLDDRYGDDLDPVWEGSLLRPVRLPRLVEVEGPAPSSPEMVAPPSKVAGAAAGGGGTPSIPFLARVGLLLLCRG